MASSKEEKKKRSEGSAAPAAKTENHMESRISASDAAAAAPSPQRDNNHDGNESGTASPSPSRLERTSPSRNDDVPPGADNMPSSPRTHGDSGGDDDDDDDDDDLDDPTLSSTPAKPSSTDAAATPAIAAATTTTTTAIPPLPNEPVPATAPSGQDDGWTCQWDPTHQAWYFYNTRTGTATWENPRMPSTQGSPAQARAGVVVGAGAANVPPLPQDKPAAGGYNPAIHGDYDPTAWYAQNDNARGPDDDNDDTGAEYGMADDGSAGAVAAVGFNRWTGALTAPGEGAERHSDEAKARRQMNAFFDVDAAANAHDGRSLKAERAGKRLTKAELKQFKEKRKARKEEKRRAWLRD